MKNLSVNIIKPKKEANVSNGRINRKLIGRIFFIDIDRPKKMNGFTPFMFNELAKSFTEFEKNKKALCAILYTSGKNFCAGMDLSKISKFILKGDNSYINYNKKYIDPLSLRKPLRSKPLIVLTNGINYTYGLELMLAADIAICAKKTRFAMLESKRGLLMTGGATLRFVDRAGWSNAMKYLLTGLEFDSKMALKMNLVQEVVSPNKLFKRGKELAEMICNVSPLAVKEIIKNARVAQISKIKAIQQFDEVQNFLGKQIDFKLGLESFKKKTEPDFR